MNALQATDPEIYALIRQEEERQANKIRLIASENYVSTAVMQATGTVLTNKYSEGYPGKRYYEGQQIIDQVESVAIARTKELFAAEHVNVQPYSGSPANLAAYLAFLQPGDTILGMALPHGGHLTHGAPVSISGRYFHAESYSVDPQTKRLDYDQVRQRALECRPRLIVAGHSAHPRILDFAKFRQIADEVGAIFMVDMAHFSGLVAGGAHPSPVPYADVVTSTTHKSLRGPRGAMILCQEKHAAVIDKAVFPGVQGGPHDHTTAAIAVAMKEAQSADFKDYAHQVVKNAKALAKTLLDKGFTLITGGTDNHLLVVDLSATGLSSKKVAKALDRAGVVLNYNTIPFDTRKPTDPSGIRMGACAVTSRGFKEKEMVFVGETIAAVIARLDDEAFLTKTAAEVKECCRRFPAPGLEHLAG